jgi:hypothetical protein
MKKTYQLDIETFTPAFRANGKAALTDCRMESRQITGYRAAVAEAKAEAAKGKLGRCVILRDASGKGRKF